MRDYTASLYTMLFELSRCYQGRLLGSTSPLTTEIQTAIDQTPNLFPSNVSVACQGVAGAYSQLACDKLFKLPHIMYFASFEAVFAAIERGLCRYGVLPLENSTAGSVNAIYDLMMKHDFRIVRSVRLKVDHNLLVKPGVRVWMLEAGLLDTALINVSIQPLWQYNSIPSVYWGYRVF